MKGDKHTAAIDKRRPAATSGCMGAVLRKKIAAKLIAATPTTTAIRARFLLELESESRRFTTRRIYSLRMLPKKAGDTFLDGKLEIIRVLGAGGMGVVYEVRHTLTKHRRALKVMTPREANATIIKRFLQEASVAGTLDTDYITQIFDAGQLEDGSF